MQIFRYDKIMPSFRLSRALVVSLLLVCAFAPSAIAANGWSTRYGVNDPRGVWLGSPGLTSNYPVAQHKALAAADLNRMRSYGFEYVRIPVPIDILDANQDGEMDSPTTNVNVLVQDSVVREAAKRGVVIHPVIEYWGCDYPSTPQTCSDSGWNVPTNMGLFQRRMKSFAARYWAGGTFFSGGAASLCGASCWFTPIGTYEIWNEPNVAIEGDPDPYPFWHTAAKTRPNATTYGTLYANAWLGIKKVSPTLSVIPAGLAEATFITTAGSATPHQYLATALLQARSRILLDSTYRRTVGTSTLPALCYADATNIHTYGWPDWSPTKATSNAINFSNSMASDVRLGGIRSTLWISEFGWRANVIGETQQALNNARFLDSLNTVPKLGMVYPYTWRDASQANTLHDGGFGIFKTLGSTGNSDTTQADGGMRIGGAVIASRAQTALKTEALRTPLAGDAAPCTAVKRYK